MAPLPASSTARVWFDYVTGGAYSTEHTIQFRYVGSDRAAAAQQDALANILGLATNGSFPVGFKVTAVRTALAGEDFSVLQTLRPALAAFLGGYGGGYTRLQQTNEITYQAHSVSSPRRLDISLFGMPDVFVAQNGRWPIGGAGTPGAINLMHQGLVAAGDTFRAIDGSAVVWYSYANTGQNAYWKRRLRIG